MEADIVRFLCGNGGAMEYDLLLDLVSGFPDMDCSKFDSLLRNKEHFFLTEIAGVKQVLAKTSLRLCKVTDCSGCKDLHLCKFYLHGECNRGRCRYGHDLNSDHNAEVLSDHQLRKFSRAEIRQLLLQNDTPHTLLPPICSKYNRGDGDYGQCEDKDTCNRLHVCEDFMRHTCDAYTCGRSHDLFEPQPVRVLCERGVLTQQVGSMRSVYHHILLLRGRRQGDPGGGGAVAVAGGRGRGQGRGGQGRGGRGRGRGRGYSDKDQGGIVGIGGRGRGRGRGSTDKDKDADQGGTADTGGRGLGRGRGSTDTDQGGTGGSRDGSSPAQPQVAEICLSFVKGFCKFENRCVRVHCKMPYLWQVRSGDTWSNLENNEDIERDYCNPDCITTLSLQGQPVHFDSMRCGDQEVRRLSTAPSVQMPDFILTTEWIWYWQNEQFTWIQYTSPMCSVSSCDLEKHYQADSKDVILFTGGKPPHQQQHYQLSFKDMEQSNLCYGTVRVVRRRPKFISADGVQTAKTSRRRGPGSSQPGRGVPGYWDKSAVPDTGYQRVTLLSSDRDYQKVQELFSKTLRGYDIISVERVQNKELWEDFQTKRERMQKANKDKKYGDGSRLLFHGTDPKHVQAICHHNFDWRKCGANGTVYGEGCYFARDASYSHNYTKEVPDHGGGRQRCMFVCRVLIGSYTRGQSHYRLPPSVDRGGLLMYDSCVNDVRDPSIFVVFDKQQVYPEFLLTYTEHVRPALRLTGSSSSSSSDSDDASSTPNVSVVASARNTVTVSTLTSSSVTPPPLLTPPPAVTLPAQTLPPPHLSPATTSSFSSSSSRHTPPVSRSASTPSRDMYNTPAPGTMPRWSSQQQVKKKEECILL